LPDSMELRICVPYNSRSTAWASFDGRGRVELKQGDHIKITASRYPFPTICADKQSTDWFHAISRTLKWNERERQKSFVVVEEESPPKAAKIKVKRSVGVKIASRAVEEPEDEEEDESDEEDTYDIDDSSFEADSATVPDSQPTGEFVGREKHPSYRHVMLPKRKSESRSRSRLRAFTSGIDSPGRFSSALNHTPTIASRHVGFNIPSSPSPDSSPPQSSQSDEAWYGARDDIPHPETPSGKSRIPKDHELNLEPISAAHGRPRGPSRGPEHHEHRAFAVWGHDESDSNASDCEA